MRMGSRCIRCVLAIILSCGCVALACGTAFVFWIGVGEFMSRKAIMWVFLVLMCLLFIIGLNFIFSSPYKGQSAGDRYAQDNGGSVDTWNYQLIIENTITSYRTGGLVISLIGGLGLLGSGYILYKSSSKIM